MESLVNRHESLVLVDSDSRLSTNDSRLSRSCCFRDVCLGLLGEVRKRGRARRRELGQTLAIELHTGVLQTVDQLTVRQAVLARGGVDSDHPQSSEISFLAPPAHERILQRGIDRLFRCAIQLALV